MDVSTSLVQAYLHVNGYFTTTDYPLVEQLRHQPARTVTDVDVLAVRFGGHDDTAIKRATPRVSGPVAAQVDSRLRIKDGHTDMIVAEIKQGRAQVNPATRNRHALAGALARFGCCDEREAPALVKQLLQHGEANAAGGHVIRMVLFASHGERAPRGWNWVHLDHVFRFLDGYLKTQHHALGHVDLHDPALAWLNLLRKCQLTLTSKAER